MPAYKDEKTGKWYCQFYYEDWTGKRKHKVKRGFERKKDAEKYERDFKSAEQHEEITVSRLISEYESHLDALVKSGTIKPTTAYYKKIRIRVYIQDYFKDAIASLVKPKDINEWVSYINCCKHRPPLDTNKKNRKARLSSNTIKCVKSTLSQIFKFGMRNHNLTSNPVEDVKNVKFYSNDKRTKYWTLEQYQIFYNSLTNINYKVFFNLLYWSGLRIGEALALTPQDISPFKLSITKNFVRTTYSETYVLTPKTLSSTREVEIPRNLYFQLEDYIQSKYIQKATEPIFEIKEQTARNFLNYRTKKLGLPKISPHILRHSYASLLYGTTKDILVVAKQVGHSNPAMTLEIYSHMVPDEDRKAVDKLESLSTAKESVLKDIENGS